MVRALKTGHDIADTVADKIGDLPGDGYVVAYGILRGTKEAFARAAHWFEIDRGYWDPSHFDGNYRLGYRDMQAIYREGLPREPHGLKFDPWVDPDSGYTMICPPTAAVCDFYGLSHMDWCWDAINQCHGKPYKIREKYTQEPLSFEGVSRVITFNSAVGWQAVQKGIQCVSSADHSLVGSFCKAKKVLDNYDRDELFDIMQAHQFKLGEKEKICKLINHYLAP